MDPELAKALDRVNNSITAADKTVGAVQRELSELRTELGQRLDRVERHVGLGPSDPPPPTRLARMASQSSLDVEALKAQVIQLDEKIDAKHDATMGVLAKQSSAMGIGIKGLKWLTSSEGRAVAIRLATLAAVVYVAFQSYVHGTAPPAPPPALPPAVDSR